MQLHWLFDKELNVPLFCQAWQMLIDKYDSLRTSFKWDGLDEPLQMVCSDVKLVWQHYDWTNLSKGQFTERLEAFLKTDRQAGFDLTCAPIMRLAIIKVEESSFYLIVTLHHIIIDGWCIPILFRELSTIYQAFIMGKKPEFVQAPPYHHYVKWLQKQDFENNRRFLAPVLVWISYTY